MKVPTGCMLIFMALVFLLTAPASAVAQNTPDVQVSDLQWTHDANKVHRLKGYYPRSPAPSPDFVQGVSAIFRNVGTKTVKSVTWEYVLYEDSDPAKVVQAYRFRNKALLRPGESARLSNAGFGIWHGRHVEARVARVEYEDKTVWQRAKN